MVSGEEKQNPFAGKKDAIAAGAQRFREGCAACHGANGEGGRGPRLVKNYDLFRITDQQVFNIIRRGIAGTSMPPSQMPDDKTWQVVAYVRSLSSPAYRAFVEGDVARGRDLFASHCESCHAIRGQGGLSGPDLSDAGAHMTVSELHEILENPAEHWNANYRPVTVHLKNGGIVDGVSRGDSTYSLQLLGEDGKLRSIDKAQVSSLDWHDGARRHAEAVRDVNPDGIRDLIAFVAQQVVRPNLENEARQRKDIH